MTDGLSFSLWFVPTHLQSYTFCGEYGTLGWTGLCVAFQEVVGVTKEAADQSHVEEWHLRSRKAEVVMDKTLTELQDFRLH